MLSDQTIAIVKSTAPILQEHGEALTRHFYKRMFAHNPEVLPYFNPAHQNSGNQQKALAGAICAYAANIDNLEALGSAVELIAQKHASLMIKPEHYPIVGENLLASIRELLGEAATDDIITAWGEAYQFLANILIGREKEIYHTQRSTPHGWEGFAPFFVTRKEQESELITSLYLERKDGGNLPHFLPGQYLTVRLPGSNGVTTMRNYSLSDKPGQSWYRISVKREGGTPSGCPMGHASGYLHEQIRVGDAVEVGPPCGDFFLDPACPSERPLVLISGGVGITPVLSMLLHTLETQPERPVFFLHSCLNSRFHAFRPRLEQLARLHPNLTVRFRYDDPTPMDLQRMQAPLYTQGRVDGELIRSCLPGNDGDYYFCGPKPFMVAIYHQLLEWGIPSGRIHFEFFGPREELERPAPGTTLCPV